MGEVYGFDSHLRALTLGLLLFFCTATSVAQTHDVLCVHGSDSFSTVFQTGVQVRVGAAKNGGLSVRACEAVLSWGDQRLTVASEAAAADLDAFGVDLGVGVPVAAFQIQKSDSDCCRIYQIYSLQKPPRLLRTITGGDFFSASDTDLDGRVEIWTDDAAAVNGLDNMSAAELDFAPPVILRFEHNRLLDVSSEFQLYFDQLIASLRKQIDSQDLRDFKNNDAKLTPGALPVEQMHRLRAVKIKVLEIVWSYLYSGREEEAWKALASLWPVADFERIRGAIAEVRRNGIRAQVDGTSAGVSSAKKKHAQIFNVGLTMEHGTQELVPPQEIILRQPPPPIEILLDLLIDSAGKVRAAESANGKPVEADLTKAVREWKFVPAFSGGHAVACKLRIAVSARR
jgi:hypothetical protein